MRKQSVEMKSYYEEYFVTIEKDTLSSSPYRYFLSFEYHENENRFLQAMIWINCTTVYSFSIVLPAKKSSGVPEARLEPNEHE